MAAVWANAVRVAMPRLLQIYCGRSRITGNGGKGRWMGVGSEQWQWMAQIRIFTIVAACGMKLV